MQIEYRVRPVTRYIITRWEREVHENGMESGGSQSFGEFDNFLIANEVGDALHKREPESTFAPFEVENPPAPPETS